MVKPRNVTAEPSARSQIQDFLYPFKFGSSDSTLICNRFYTCCDRSPQGSTRHQQGHLEFMAVHCSHNRYYFTGWRAGTCKRVAEVPPPRIRISVDICPFPWDAQLKTPSELGSTPRSRFAHATRTTIVFGVHESQFNARFVEERAVNRERSGLTVTCQVSSCSH